MYLIQFSTFLATMHILTVVLLLVTFDASSESSIGTELASIVSKVFGDEIEICILHDHRHPRWHDLVNEFAQQLGYHLCPVVQLDDLQLAERSCQFYLVYLEVNFELLGEFVDGKLQSRKWNRFGKFVFVTDQAGSRTELRSVWTFYGSLVHHLAIPNSVLLVMPFENGLVLSYNLFRRNLYFCKFSDLGNVLARNNLLDVKGHLFNVLLYDITLYLHVLSPKRATGPFWHLVRVFTNHINASLRVAAVPKRPNHKLFFTEVPVSIVFNYYQTLLEFVSGHGMQTYCLTVPEHRLGSFFNNLLYPFTTELWLFILFICIVSAAVCTIFPRVYPRNILTQLLYGVVIRDHDLTQVERFSLHLLIVILFILTESYQAKMIQFMVENKYEAHVSSMDEFLASDAVIHTYSTMYKTFLLLQFPQLLNSGKVILTPNETFTNQTSVVIFTSCVAANAFVNSVDNIDPQTGDIRIYTVVEPLSETLLGHTLSRTEPFTQRFKQVYDRLQEAGLPDFWMQIMRTYHSRKPDLVVTMLAFEELISLWWILAYGWGSAGVALLGEHLAVNREIWLRIVMKMRGISRKLSWSNSRVSSE